MNNLVAVSVLRLLLVHQDDVFSKLVLHQIHQDFEEFFLVNLESEGETVADLQVQEQLQELWPFVARDFQGRRRRTVPGHFHTVLPARTLDCFRLIWCFISGERNEQREYMQLSPERSEICKSVLGAKCFVINTLCYYIKWWA